MSSDNSSLFWLAAIAAVIYFYGIPKSSTKQSLQKSYVGSQAIKPVPPPVRETNKMFNAAPIYGGRTSAFSRVAGNPVRAAVPPTPCCPCPAPAPVPTPKPKAKPKPKTAKAAKEAKPKNASKNKKIKNALKKAGGAISKGAKSLVKSSYLSDPFFPEVEPDDFRPPVQPGR